MFGKRGLLIFYGLSATLISTSVAFGDDLSSGARGAGANADVAKKLQNPVANLISAPIENNLDFGLGPNGDGHQYKVNIQPVIPFSIGQNWNLITRTIVPIVYQQDVIGKTRQSGLSDSSVSLFVSPKAPTRGGWIWGAGPVLLLPTATDDRLGTQKWGAGPTAVVLRQQHGWTYGALVNHVWSYAGASSRENVSATYLLPFLNYTTTGFTTFGIDTESTYDWTNHQWTVPINLTVSQLFKIDGRPLSVLVGARYYADKPGGGAGWGLRSTVTLLFPKK